MRNKIIISILMLEFWQPATAEQGLSFGLGLGALYNGVGVNVAHQENDSLSYLSVGCIRASYGTNSGVNAICGFGVGYLTTNMIASSNKHGFGVHAGISVLGLSVEGPDFGYQIGLSYVYFFQGVNSPGWNIGLTPLIDHYNGWNSLGGLFEIGYQF